MNIFNYMCSGKESPWLVPTQDQIYDSRELIFLELHATAMLCLPSGECLSPDATLCTTLTSALYSSVSEEEVLKRQLMVHLPLSPNLLGKKKERRELKMT